MLESLERVEKLKGTVITDGEPSGSCRYELTYNPYNTNSMRIILLDPTFDPPAPNTRQIDIETDFEWGKYALKLNTELASFSSDKTGRRYRAPVNEFWSIQYFAPIETAAEVSAGYLFPLTSITNNPGGTTRHSSYGFVRGSYDPAKNIFNPKYNPISVPSEVGEIEVADEFDFHNGPTELYAQTHLIRRSYAGLKVLTDKGTVDEVLKQVRDLMEKLFRVISLVERNRIDWHTERVAIRSSDGSPVAKIDTYRWVSPPSEGYRPQFDVRHEGRKTLLTAFQAYANADVDDDIIISKTIDNFMIASCAKTLESKFIHWHSCLDFFKKVHQIPRMAFSKELVMMFDKCGLPLDDLLSKSAVETVRAAGKKGKAPAFTFTDLRNRYAGYRTPGRNSEGHCIIAGRGPFGL